MRWRIPFVLLGLSALAPLAAVSGAACFPAAGVGVEPPTYAFYFPVGLAVSRGGNVLYAVNSDFDLQWNGGTIQSLDLHLIRRHTLLAIKDPADPNLPLALPFDPNASCPGSPVVTTTGDAGAGLGWACAPPTNASYYMRDSVIIGAFATDLQRSRLETPCVSDPTKTCSRLFSPTRGDASLTWADVVADDPNVAPGVTDTSSDYAPFKLHCGASSERPVAGGSCDSVHHAGNDPNQLGDTRLITMPGEPFGMAQSMDGQSIVITHQTDTKTSLFSTYTPLPGQATTPPALQFVLDGLPVGGIAVAAIPHDPQAYPECIADPTSDACKAAVPRPAFLQTSLSAPQVSLLRYYSDQGDQGVSAPFRPFIQNEANTALTVNAGATDFARGIAIDPTPRIFCKAHVPPADPTAVPPRTQADVDADTMACARLPARVFIASRSGPSLIIGSVGAETSPDGAYDADQLHLQQTVPLPPGPSGVYLAPVVDRAGNYALRVFVICFDANQIIVFDPDTNQIESVLRVGLGPFGLTFDPFDMTDVALNKPVPFDSRDADLSLRRYRFAYVASFTQSYVQVIDLDNGSPDKSTYGTVVYTLGMPTNPKGT